MPDLVLVRRMLSIDTKGGVALLAAIILGGATVISACIYNWDKLQRTDLVSPNSDRTVIDLQNKIDSLTQSLANSQIELETEQIRRQAAEQKLQAAQTVIHASPHSTTDAELAQANKTIDDLRTEIAHKNLRMSDLEARNASLLQAEARLTEGIQRMRTNVAAGRWSKIPAPDGSGRTVVIAWDSVHVDVLPSKLASELKL